MRQHLIKNLKEQEKEILVKEEKEISKYNTPLSRAGPIHPQSMKTDQLEVRRPGTVAKL